MRPLMCHTKVEITCLVLPGCDLEEPFAADCLGLCGEPTALTIGESQALSAQLFAEHPVLLLQVLDNVLLTV